MEECLTAEELRQLMTLTGEDCVREIQQKYGSIEGLCWRLNTDPDLGQCSINQSINKFINVA